MKENKCLIDNCSNIKYIKAFNILMDYFDYIPEEEKPIIDKKLKRLGL